MYRLERNLINSERRTKIPLPHCVRIIVREGSKLLTKYSMKLIGFTTKLVWPSMSKSRPVVDNGNSRSKSIR